MTRKHSCTCGETDPEKFYGNRKNGCAKCHNRYTIEQGKKKRKYAVDKLGGKCVACGFNRWIEALDIHHTNPSAKDPNFSSMRGWSIERIDRELVDCVLLCRNCHAAGHAGHDIESEIGSLVDH